MRSSDSFTSAKQHSNGTGSEKEPVQSDTWGADVTATGMTWDSNDFVSALHSEEGSINKNLYCTVHCRVG